MRFALALCFLGLLFSLVFAARPKPKHRLDGIKARKEIGNSSKDMESSVLLVRKAKEMKKEARKEKTSPKRSTKLKIAENLERLAMAKKRKAVKVAEKAVAIAPLEAIKTLRKLKKSSSPVLKKSASMLATQVKKAHKREDKQLRKIIKQGGGAIGKIMKEE